ncbi:MAG: efflux RND transporter periplasmic adaptor subunit [Planctomycetales bacterium]|nr:efflux RND transporter periplasmic adaptor subunit [Planctomycetales bacterium]
MLIVLAAGCQQKGSPGVAKTTPPPEVVVTVPVEREFAPFEEFTGRLEASEVIEIRARVGGYLDQVLFRDGAEVKKDELLAVIDPRTYEAELARATAAVQQAKSRQQRMAKELERGRQLLTNKVVTQEDFDRMQFDHAEAETAQQIAEANEALAQLNLGFTEIRSPVNGKISRRLIDQGNLVKVDDSLLATIGATDPIHAYFEIDERTVLRLRQLILGGQMRLPTEQKLEVQLSLANENYFSLRGVIDFTDNALDPHTGTLRARATIDNGSLLLLPGLIVRCRMPIGSARTGLFIPEEALGSDQGQRYLYVLNDKDEVVYRRVSVGVQMSGWRFVEGELTKEDRVIVTGLQRVRQGQKVAPKVGTQYADSLPVQDKPKQAVEAPAKSLPTPAS